MPPIAIAASFDSKNRTKRNGFVTALPPHMESCQLVRRSHRPANYPMRIGILFVVFFAPLSYTVLANGQETPFDPDRTVVPITKLKIGSISFNTGFCLNPNCSYIGTNYHVALATGSPLKIKGEKVTEKYLDTSPTDEGATVIRALGSGVPPMVFNLSRDLAIFGLRHPLAPRGMRGVTFSLDELEEGQEVDIYAYPLTSALMVKRSLTKFPATYAGETREGLLGFNFETSERGQSITPGASGGLIIDRKSQQAVGILTGVATGTKIAAAISVQTLAEFLKRVRPELYEEMFPDQVRQHVSTAVAQADIYPRYVPTSSLSGEIQYRQTEAAEIKRLREKGQELADSIKDFIAVQTLEYGGMKRPPAPLEYEVRVIDGRQQFREYPNGLEELRNIPLPSPTPLISTADDWSTMPNLVGTELKLKMREAQDVVMGGRRTKVFQYYASIEDKVCKLRIIDDYILFERVKDVMGSCSGEVWTDEDLNIIRISENDDFPQGTEWRNLHAVATYGWLDKPEESSRLVPLSVFVQAETNGKVYWCRGRFTNYQVFSAKAKLVQ
jgi:hypothetical protein